MRTVRSLRKCSPHDKLCRWGERERGWERRRRERKEKDNAVPSSNRLIQNPLHMIQKYSTVWIIHPWLSALKPLDCVGPTHTITSHLQSRHSLPDSTLTQQITTINTQLLSSLSSRKNKPKKQHSLRKCVKSLPLSYPHSVAGPPVTPQEDPGPSSRLHHVRVETQKKAHRKRAEQPGAELVTWGCKRNTGRWVTKKKKKKATPADFTRLWPHHALYYQTHHLPVCQCWW